MYNFSIFSKVWYWKLFKCAVILVTINASYRSSSIIFFLPCGGGKHIQACISLLNPCVCRIYFWCIRMYYTCIYARERYEDRRGTNNNKLPHRWIAYFYQNVRNIIYIWKTKGREKKGSKKKKRRKKKIWII